MSPNVGNFVHDLVEMAKAMEELPQVQRAFELANQRNDELARTVQHRELAIIDYKAQIEELNSKVRSLEVERDDASFRVMEAEDREHAALNVARSIASAAGDMINTLNPPRPEPELQPQAVPTQEEKHTEQTVVGSEYHSEAHMPDPFSGAGGGLSQSLVPEEAPKSDVNPPESSSTASGDGSTLGDTPKGPYFDKRYHDMPNYIPRWDWLDGGGTDADYDWRPSNPSYGSTH